MSRESMRTALEFGKVRQRTSQEQRIEVPVGGWNTRDSLDDIPPTDAIIMDNWIPDIGAVRVRGGFTTHCETGETGSIQSLFEYHDIEETSRKILASVNAKIFDVSSSTATDMNLPNPTADPAYERSGSIYDVSMIETEDSNISAPQMWVNGIDYPLMFDGVKFRAPSPDPSAEGVPDNFYLDFSFESYFPGAAVPSSANGLIGVTTFKNRLYYWEDGSQDFWYTSLYAASGEVKKFPLGATGNYGGKLVAIETWTKDGGSGPDDFIVFFMASGEAVVYQGSSPEDIYNWSIVGRYDIGEPIGKRAITKLGGDIVIVTTFGYVFFSQLMQGVEANGQKTKIDGAVRSALRSSLSTFGWEIITFPKEKMIIFNVPYSGGYEQHVMNQVTGAWCRFRGFQAVTFCTYRNDLYFGSTDGNIYQALDGDKDGDNPIHSDIQTAWLKIGGTTPKTFVAFKEQYRSTREIETNNEFGIDYEPIQTTQFPTPVEEKLIYWTNEDAFSHSEVPTPAPWDPPPPGGTGDLPNGTPIGPPFWSWQSETELPVAWWSHENYAGSPPPAADETTYWPGLRTIIFGEWEFIQGHGSVISMRKKMSTFQFYEMLAYRFLYEMSGRL